MDSLTGNITSAVIGGIIALAVGYISQLLRPKIKILYWVSHNFMYTMPENPYLAKAEEGQLALPQVQQAAYNLLTISVNVQNFGRETADWVEIVHRRRPDFFQLHPPLDYIESTTPSGQHVLRLNSLAPKEWVSLQLLSYRQQPELAYIRSSVGHASSMPWMQVRQYPAWVYRSYRGMLVIALGTCLYWLIRLGQFLVHLARR